MLRLIYGKSGSGKTFYLYNEIKKYIDSNDGREIYIIVPEQSSFDTECELLDFLGIENYRKVKVFSISRLAHKLIREYKKNSLKMINSAGKHLTMALAISEVKDRLKLFRASAGKPDFINMTVEAADNFKIRNIGTKELQQAGLKVKNSVLKAKIKDTVLILDAYDALLSKAYLDPTDNIKRLFEITKENGIFKNTLVFFDSFTGFTPIENLFIEEVIKQSDEAYFSLCTDLISDENSIYITINNTVKKIKDFARNNGVKVSKPIETNFKDLSVSKEIQFLNDNIFKEDSPEFSDEALDIKICECNNFYDECDFAALQIKKFIINNGYKYGDFAVIARDETKLTGVIDNIFEKYGIPYFMDRRVEIQTSPLFSFVFSALKCVSSGFDEEDFFRMLKTSLTEIAFEEIALLENYVMQWQIRGSDLVNPFTENPSGLGRAFSDEDKAELERLNEIRLKAITPLVKFKKSVTDASGQKIARAIYDLLIDFDVVSRLKVLKEAYKKENAYKARELVQIWDALIELLDQISAVLNEKVISIKEFTSLFNLITSDIDIGTLPQGKDRVTVSIAGRSRIKSPKIAFVIGANEGIFPGIPSNSGLFNDDECNILSQFDIKISDDINEMTLAESYFAYTAVSCAKEKLYISYSKSDLLGNELEPSSIVKEAQRLFPKISCTEKENINSVNTIWNENQAFELLGRLDKTTTLYSSLFSYFSSEEKYKDKLECIKKAQNKAVFKLENSSVTNMLSDRSLTLSPTQIEKFHLCKFQHFCQYGLSLKENKKAVFDSMQYGSFIHYILENMLKNYEIEKLKNFSRTQINDIADELINNYIDEFMGGKENKSARFLALCKKISYVIKELIQHMVKELSQSGFVPTDFELTVGNDIPAYKLKLDDGRIVSVKGKIDRVDIMTVKGEDGGESKFVRVIDYKTGFKAFKLSDILSGLNLQMLLYLAAVSTDNGNRYKSDVIPAGILYLPSSVTDVLTERNISDVGKANEINKMLVMNGLILDDSRVIYGMENKAEGIYIPIKIKDGTIKAGKDSLVSYENLMLIFKKINSLIKNMSDEISNGNIENIPLNGADVDACEWCLYGTVCGFEKGDNCKLMIKTKNNSEALEIITEEAEVENQNDGRG